MSKVGSMDMKDMENELAPEGGVAVVAIPNSVAVVPAHAGIVVTQPSKPVVHGYPQDLRDWSSGLCDCQDDGSACCFTCCCMCCMWCSVTRRLGEHCCTAYCVHGGTMALRTKFRMQHGITGSVCKDFCVTSFCCCIGLCQLDRELKALGHY